MKKQYDKFVTNTGYITPLTLDSGSLTNHYPEASSSSTYLYYRLVSDSCHVTEKFSPMLFSAKYSDATMTKIHAKELIFIQQLINKKLKTRIKDYIYFEKFASIRRIVSTPHYSPAFHLS